MGIGQDVKAHQIEVDWMGEPVLTPQDIWPETPQAMIVGLNPAPASVEAGHYYQRRSGRRQLLRLADAGLFARPNVDEIGFEPAALRAQVGFTDLVKRPTLGEQDVSVDELEYGRKVLFRDLESHSVPLVICVFRHPVTALLGASDKPGFQTGPTPWGGRVFRMPGPFAASSEVKDVMAQLSRTLMVN